MNMLEAQNLLMREKIDPFIYNIGRPKLAECLVLEHRGSHWVVYTWEKGSEKFMEVYADEDSAARAFVKEVFEISAISKKIER